MAWKKKKNLYHFQQAYEQLNLEYLYYVHAVSGL